MKIKQFSSFFRRYISTFAVGQHPNPRTNLHTLRIRKAIRFMSFRLAILNIDRQLKVGNTSLSLDNANRSFGKISDILTLKTQNKIYYPIYFQLMLMLQQHRFIKLVIFLFELKNNIREKLTMAHH
jgi:hypothetical protein